MENITLLVSTLLAENNYIKEKDKELYRYGIEMFIICVLEMCAVLFLALIKNTVKGDDVID